MIHSPTKISSTNPYTGAVLRTFAPHSPTEIENKVSRAVEAQVKLARSSFAFRKQSMLRAADLLEVEQERFARTITEEMGKPLQASRDEVAKCANVCKYYAENAEKFLEDFRLESDHSQSYVRFQPLGIILAVMPWNFPFWQVFRFAAPGLMAGNAGLLKHASNVPQCALAIEEIFARSGFPEASFQALLISSREVAGLLEDQRIKAVTLTGSEPAGSQVASIAGKYIKRTVLELGGSDPFVVMPSANLEVAVTLAIKSRTLNAGQSCISAKRFIIHSAIYKEFEARFVEGMQNLKVGDPMLTATEMGPLATAAIREDLHKQVKASLNLGAKLLTGGNMIDGKGWLYEPTVLSHISTNSPAYQEELFGPVASLFEVSHLEEAIHLANDTRFGLGASVWTQDQAEQLRLINGIESGQVFVNSMVASDPRLPFGGVKASGYGRELGAAGIKEFVNQKTVCVN